MSDKISEFVIECFLKLEQEGIYFHSGTLIFSDVPMKPQGLQVLINRIGDNDV